MEKKGGEKQMANQIYVENYIYLLERKGGWDETHAIIVVAAEESKARAYACQESCGSEDKMDWLNKSSCKKIGVALDGVAGIVLEHIERS